MFQLIKKYKNSEDGFSNVFGVLLAIFILIISIAVVDVASTKYGHTLIYNLFDPVALAATNEGGIVIDSQTSTQVLANHCELSDSTEQNLENDKGYNSQKQAIKIFQHAEEELWRKGGYVVSIKGTIGNSHDSKTDSEGEISCSAGPNDRCSFSESLTSSQKAEYKNGVAKFTIKIKMPRFNGGYRTIEKLIESTCTPANKKGNGN